MTFTTVFGTDPSARAARFARLSLRHDGPLAEQGSATR